MNTTCNNCLDEFQIESGGIQTVRIEDLDIQFFSCPSCGQKYLVFAADDEMKKLVVARNNLQKRIRTAHQNKFRQETIQKLVGEQRALIQKQKNLWEKMKPSAEQLLKEAQI